MKKKLDIAILCLISFGVAELFGMQDVDDGKVTTVESGMISTFRDIAQIPSPVMKNEFSTLSLIDFQTLETFLIKVQSAMIECLKDRGDILRTLLESLDPRSRIYKRAASGDTEAIAAQTEAKDEIVQELAYINGVITTNFVPCLRSVLLYAYCTNATYVTNYQKICTALINFYDVGSLVEAIAKLREDIRKNDGY